MLLNRGKNQKGPFGLTRDSRDTRGRGKDYKLISAGYVIAEFLMLGLAPIEKWTWDDKYPNYKNGLEQL